MAKIKEIPLNKLKAQGFIKAKIEEIAKTVGAGTAINALSGGVDSSVVTVLAFKSLGDRLKTCFIDSGLMRHKEPQSVVSLFKKLGVPVKLIDAKQQFFDALKGIEDPEKKREAITHVFYKVVFGDLVKKSGARFLLQGTNYTDVEETVAGIKRQHNILAQLGIDTEEVYGYQVIEPLIELRKSGIRRVGKALGLPDEIYERPPFPGPALAARVIGEDCGRRARHHGCIPVSRHPPSRQGDGYQAREAGLRSPDRSEVLGEHRCKGGNPHKALLRQTDQAGGQDDP
jgi:GMP synthase (glutamine-hydrolysing)